MKFNIVDAQLPPALARTLRAVGCEAFALSELGPRDATDAQLWKSARSIAVESALGQPGVIQQVAHLERGVGLQPPALGLSLAEARSILAGLEETMVQAQAAEFVAQVGRCPRCGRQRACKGRHAIVFRTPFGKLSLDSPRLYRCPCESEARNTFSPLAEVLCERTSPELLYLETNFAALVSYGLTAELLKEVLPIGQALDTMSLRR